MYASEENVRYFQQLVRSFVPRHKAESQAPQSETLAEDLALEKTPGVSLLVSVAGGFGNNNLAASPSPLFPRHKSLLRNPT